MVGLRLSGGAVRRGRRFLALGPYHAADRAQLTQRATWPRRRQGPVRRGLPVPDPGAAPKAAGFLGELRRTLAPTGH